MTRIKYPAYLWAFVVTQVGFACSDIRFLKRLEGESVVLPCELKQGNKTPIIVNLNRTWLHPMQVLYMYTKESVKVYNDADKNRTSVIGDPSLGLLNVTISQLKASDTDRYYCEFIVENFSNKDIKKAGKMEFFLLVGAGCSGFICTDEHKCGGPCYSFLLYTVPLTVVILLLLITGFVVISKCKAHKSMMSHEASVYEDMVGMKSQTRGPAHLEEQCALKKGSSENPYE